MLKFIFFFNYKPLFSPVLKKNYFFIFSKNFLFFFIFFYFFFSLNLSMKIYMSKKKKLINSMLIAPNSYKKAQLKLASCYYKIFFVIKKNIFKSYSCLIYFTHAYINFFYMYFNFFFFESSLMNLNMSIMSFFFYALNRV